MSERRALLVGINTYHRTIGSLRGCVADLASMKSLLCGRFAFSQSMTRVLENRDATRAAILDGLQWLVGNAASGDVLVFSYSGHGTFLPNVNDPSGRDEALVAFSPQWEDLLANELSCSAIFRPENWNLQFIRDKEIKGIADQIAPGVNLTLIMDCCHSGDINREPGLWPRFVQPPPNVINQVNEFYDANQQYLQAAEVISQDKLDLGQIAYRFLRGNRFDYVDSDETSILLAACSPSETATERPFGDTWRGVFSYYLANYLAENQGGVSHRELIAEVAQRMRMTTQRPRLSCRPDLQGRSFLKPLES